MPKRQTSDEAPGRALGRPEETPRPGGKARAGFNEDSLDARGLVAHRYRVLFEHNLAGVYCTTFDGTILDCNESLAAMLG